MENKTAESKKRENKRNQGKSKRLVIDEKTALKLYRREKRRRKRHLIWLCVLVSVVIVCVFAYRAIKPIYVDTSNVVYDILSNMTSADFIREGDTIIYAADGEVIGEYGNEKYEYVPLADISDYITNGYIAKEDKNFKIHKGIDPVAILRAGLSYVKNKGVITQGGSTITQQLIKNSLLSQERTFSRKITEIFLALEIEKDYSKTDIMEFYCNSNYYGNGCYGVEAAAQYYFGKSAKEVTLAEAAIIVATSNSPNNYNPVVNYDLAMEKKDVVLNRMLEEGYITEEELQEASAERPEIVQQVSNVENNNYLVSYAAHCAALKLMGNSGFTFQYLFESPDAEEEYAELYDTAYDEAMESIRSGGYQIYTSFDLSIQDELQNQIDNGLSGFSDVSESGIYELQGAGVCIDNESQMVVAIVGGRSGSGEFNRGYQATRQPGSSIKPLLVYGPAFDLGVAYPGLTMVDEETTIDGYTPRNAGDSYRGLVTVREALVRSINTIALQTFDEAGGLSNLDYLAQMQFSSLAYADTTALAVSIGGFTNGVTVCDMARGYATIANGGSYSYNDCIVSIKTYTDESVYESSDAEKFIYNADTAFMLTDVMNGLFEEEYGSAYRASKSGQYYAGKTGTTNNNKDAWFCGFSSYYTTAIWVGYDYPDELGFSGGDYPQDIWVSFMDAIHSNLEPELFDIPSTIKLVNDSGDLMDASYNGYHSRPEGYDYTSEMIYKEQKSTWQEKTEKQYEEAAESAVRDFEAYVITNTSEAENLDAAYQAAYSAVSQVTDSTLRSELMTRLSYKYNLLSGEVAEKWIDAKASEEAAEQDRKDAENAIAAQESLEQAINAEKETRIELVNYYVDLLNGYTVYSDAVETICVKAENALALCVSYSEYNSLSLSVRTATSRARSLPDGDTLLPSNQPEMENTEDNAESWASNENANTNGYVVRN